MNKKIQAVQQIIENAVLLNGLTVAVAITDSDTVSSSISIDMPSEAIITLIEKLNSILVERQQKPIETVNTVEKVKDQILELIHSNNIPAVISLSDNGKLSTHICDGFPIAAFNLLQGEFLKETVMRAFSDAEKDRQAKNN